MNNVGRYVGLRRGEYWERTESGEYYCGGCGWKVTDHDSYCPECGGALLDEVRERTCHKEWRKDGYGFCSECGANVTSACNRYCWQCGRRIVEVTE